MQFICAFDRHSVCKPRRFSRQSLIAWLLACTFLQIVRLLLQSRYSPTDIQTTPNFSFSTSPIHTYRGIFENGVFFLRLSLASTRQRRFRASGTQFFGNGSQSGVSLKRAYLSLSCGRTRTKVLDYDDAIHHTAHAL